MPPAGRPLAAHDVGGRAAGAVDRDEHDHALWERRVDAMMMLLSKRGLLVVDELRRNIESLGPGAYAEMGYYERWVAALAGAMNERGVVTTRRTRPAHGRGRAKVMTFAAGDPVVVRDAWQGGHVRTPAYIKGSCRHDRAGARRLSQTPRSWPIAAPASRRSLSTASAFASTTYGPTIAGRWTTRSTSSFTATGLRQRRPRHEESAMTHDHDHHSEPDGPTDAPPRSWRSRCASFWSRKDCSRPTTCAARSRRWRRRNAGDRRTSRRPRPGSIRRSGCPCWTTPPPPRRSWGSRRARIAC